MPDLALTGRDVAAIDIGSNSVRLVLYRLEGRAIWTVFNEKVLAGLGRDLPTTGKLSPEGVVMAMTALRRFAAVLEGVRPDATLIAATAAVREARDGPEFCQRVAAETGLQIRVLSGEEEAKYAAMGVLAGAPDAQGVSADMGGASLELTRLDGAPGAARSVEQGLTLPLGPFALAEGKGFDADRIKARIDQRLKPVAAQFQTDRLYAVGGAWRTLAQVHMALKSYPLKVVHQYEITADEALETARLVAQQSAASLAKLPSVSKKRAETLPYAGLVLEGLIKHLNLKRIEMSAWGVREGLLFETLDEATQAADPLLAGCAALGGRQGIRDGVLSAAACRLSDLGARLHPDHRLELVFDQVLRAPVAGVSHAERAFLACAMNARYGGGPATPQPDIISRLLNEDAAKRARALGLAIRLACDLSGRSSQLLANATATVGKTELKLTATEGYADVLLGEQTKKRAKALAEAMGLGLKI
ncbi:MAG: exopolyphosphatase [Brevundimonas sp. 32-68-21]|nr:MAG: exopolyphosphatase [Brevundimonas sp. 32-68-21]